MITENILDFKEVMIMLMPRLFGELDNLFDGFAPAPMNRVQGPARFGAMKTDISETEDAFEVDIELPGYKKEDITAELKNGYLVVSAKTEESKDTEDEAKKYICKERYFGSCQRSFYVGDDMKQENIGASFTDGVLRLSIPKHVEKAEEDKKLIQIAG